MGLWESGETKWQLLCWSFFFFLLFSFSVKGKIKSNTSFQCLPDCPSFLLCFYLLLFLYSLQLTLFLSPPNPV